MTMADPLLLPTPQLAFGDTPISTLQACLQEEVQKLDAPRLGIIILDVSICTQYDTPLSYESANICELIESHKHTNAYVYIHPKYASVQQASDSSDVVHTSTSSSLSSSNDEEPEVDPFHERKLLSESIQRASILGGDSIYVAPTAKRSNQNNNSKKEIRCFRLSCQCSRVYEGKKADASTGTIIPRDDYRLSSITNDRKNQRKGHKGRVASHRTNTVRRLSKNDVRCPLLISVYHNDSGYYIKPKPGNGYHQYHAVRPNIRMPIKLLQGEDALIMKDLSSAKALTRVAVNAHFVRSSRRGTPTLLSKDQVCHICRGKKEKESNDKTEGSSTKETSDMDDLFEFLETSGSSYVALIQEVKTADSATASSTKACSLFNETRIEDSVTKDTYEILTVEDESAETITNDFRRSRKIRDDQEMVVGVAYVTPFESRQFKLFHCVLQVDATADSNNEGRPLVTGTAKDSEGKMFTVFRAFLPNEQAWSFKWLFQVVCPALLGQETLDDVNIVLTDGDSQQILMLENAIKLYFPDTYRGRCSWHIIDRGWTKNVKLAMGGHKNGKRPLHLKGTRRKKPRKLTEQNRVARKLYRWIFSWAQADYCDSREEFEVSKALFIRFVKSAPVVDVLGTGTVEAILSFLKVNVFPHEYRFCFYVRRAMFHLETHSNTSHEGTNNGLKNCAAPVMPQNSVERAVETLSFNADLKTRDTMIRLSDKRVSKKLWSSSPTANNITDLGEGLVRFEWEKGAVWNAVRDIDVVLRWITYHQNEEEAMNEVIGPSWEDELEEDEDEQGNAGSSADTTKLKLKRFGHLPKFNRVYVVTVDENGCLVCNCVKHTRMGFCCRHIGAVMRMEPLLKAAYPNGYPLSSLKVFWRQEHYVYGMSTDPTHNSIKASLSSLAKRDTTGVSCPTNLMGSCETTTEVPEHIMELLHAPAEFRVLNYSPTVCTAALRDLQDCRNPASFGHAANVPVGLSQTSHFGSNNEEDDMFSFLINNPENNAHGHTSERLKRTFYDATEAIYNSEKTEELEIKLYDFMNKIIVEARGSCSTNVEQKGKRLSMYTASSKRRKTHGTAHMHYI